MIRRLSCFGLALSMYVFAEEYESPDLKGVMIEVKKIPNKCEMKSAHRDFVEVHYSTKIAPSSATGTPGKKIDTSRDADELNDPMSFQLGGNRVLPGWDKGMLSMCEGEIRHITIPPEHAYGDDGYKHKNSDGEMVEVPAGATLRIEAELVKIIRLQKKTTFMPENCKIKSKPSDKMSVHYTLWIHKTSISGDKGKKVESSLDSKPLDFTLGGGRVILAWDQGLEGVCEGEKLEFVVPPELGYKEKGSGEKIPPMATLHFKIEVVKITEDNMFGQMDTNFDGKIHLAELGFFMEKRQGLKDKEVVQKIFDGEDKNQDGFIDWDEAPFPKGERPSGSKTEEL